ncbi:MAG TPA: sigma-70 family RNA polymerase sigma factor [Planctomycetota bacterium]|nr:sigma-70 family RNA polymerase sigma factor [Planctomycetota bacterium]
MAHSQFTEAEVEQAIRDVQGGSTGSYGIVIQFYARRLRALVAKHCPPSVETDEIAHLTFVTAYREIQRYQPDTQFFGWLGSIARMLILAELKRVKRDSYNRKNYLEYETVQGLEDLAADPAEAGEAKIHALRTCTSQLSEEHQSLLRMRYVEETSIENLSKKLNKTLSAVKVQLFFIRKKLRDCVIRRLAIQKEA